MNARSTAVVMHPLLLAAIAVAVLFVAESRPLIAQQDPDSIDAELVCARQYLKKSAAVGQFLFKSYANKDEGGCLQVVRNGRIIFRKTDWWPEAFTLGQPENKGWKAPAIPNGTDITGRGHPDMIVSEWTGGAHCCLIHHVFELEPAFRSLATIDGRDDDMAHFEDLDGNGHYYYIGADWTFAYWWLSFAGSPSHEIVLRWIDKEPGGGYHLAMDKMRRPAPSAEEWRSARNRVLAELRLEQANMMNFLPDVLWQEELDLIYTGHSELAWKFLDEVGPAAQDPRYHYPDLVDFCSTLKSSPYWPDLAPTLLNVPPACARAKPSRH